MSESFLAVVDADRIHDYVFSPHRLKLIRGGSNILREINEIDLPALAARTGKAISSAGGTILAEYDSEPGAVRFCQEACRLVGAKTVAATATSAAGEGSDFKSSVDNAFERLERNKAARKTGHWQASSAYWKICEDCGCHPASVLYSDADGDRHAACAACARRRRYSEASPYLDEISRIAGRHLLRNGSFEDLAKISRPQNYLAFVYIDLDRLGRLLHDHGTRSSDQYSNLSESITATVQGATFEACARLPDPGASRAPFEILLIGGDDAIVMLPAQNVFPFLRCFQREFDKRANEVRRVFEIPEEELRYSVGIAWAHHRYPIAQFRARAEELLRSAKKKSGNSVDFMVLTGSMAESVEDQAGRKVDRQSLRRTMKPYTVEDFLNLEATVLRWKGGGIPSSKAHALYRIAYESREQAMLDYWTLYSRLESKHQAIWDDTFFKPEGLWLPEGVLRSTPAADLVEVWDFVEAE